MNRFPVFSTLTISFLLVFVAGTSAAWCQDTRSDLMLIFDASGSMWGQVEGKNKIVIAREVLNELLSDMPDDVDLGLVAYGHRREGDCSDIEVIASMGAMSGTEISQQVEVINPRGRTPITRAINETFSALSDHQDPTTVVLLSDGIETCGGDPCEAVRNAKETGISFIMHVIGFDVAEEDVSQLECAAQEGGGLYLDANSAEDLAVAFERAVETPVDSTAAVVVVKGMALGELLDVAVDVVESDTGGWVAGARTYTDPSTNPRYLRVPSGTFDVEVTAVGLEGSIKRRFQSLSLAPGDTVSKVVDFSPGELLVGATRNGELSDASVRVRYAGTSKEAASNRTYTSASSNPRRITVTSGTYDVEIKALEIEGGPTKIWEGVDVSPGGETSLTHNFSSGEIWIGAVNGSELVDATVRIRDTETGIETGASRTYTSDSSNPSRFIVPPGTYEVVVGAVRMEGRPSKTISVTVEVGGSVTETVDFSQ